MSADPSAVRHGAKTVLFTLMIWLCLAIATAMGRWFESASALGVAVTVWGLTIASLFLCATVPALRKWTATVDLRWLVGLHLTRFIGFYFLYLMRRDELPSDFAVPAGIGDNIVAALALILLALSGTQKRNFLVGWNTLGFIDIVLVVFTALRIGLENWASMHALREFPLSLLPLFLVPIIITSHLLIFFRAKRLP